MGNNKLSRPAIPGTLVSYSRSTSNNIQRHITQSVRAGIPRINRIELEPPHFNLAQRPSPKFCAHNGLVTPPSVDGNATHRDLHSNPRYVTLPLSKVYPTRLLNKPSSCRAPRRSRKEPVSSAFSPLQPEQQALCHTKRFHNSAISQYSDQNGII